MEKAENRRAYRSELRQRQAAETRKRVVDAAAEAFGKHGYQAATFAQIAKLAGVSVETVQKHGPKAALLWASVEVASFGVEGDIDVLSTEHAAAMRDARDPGGFATAIGRSMLAINEPVAGVWTAVTAAALGDPEIRSHLAERLAYIRKQVAKVLRLAGDRDWLRTDVPFDDLVEAVCVITSVESYLRVVRLDGKSHKKYQAFVTRTIGDTILRR